MTEATPPILEVSGLTVGYGNRPVLHGLDLAVASGEVVVVLGANGAGKTTLLQSLAGTLTPMGGQITIDGERATARRPDAVLRAGICLIPQGRGTMADLDVLDNLRVGAITRKDRKGVAADIERWFDVFPSLRRLGGQPAGLLSGGEQQMLAVARAMMSRPRLLLCDEISLGLAPVIVKRLFDVLRDLNDDERTALLLVEQNASLTLRIADRVHVLEVGRFVAEGPVDEFRDNDTIRRAYLGY